MSAADTMRWPEEWQVMAVELLSVVSMLTVTAACSSNAGLTLAREQLQERMDALDKAPRGSIESVEAQLYRYLTSYLDQLLQLPEAERMLGTP